MTEGLHNPKPIQEALEPHAARLRLKTCDSCGKKADDDSDLALYVMPSSNGVHPTPQLTAVCDFCAMEIAEALAELFEAGQ